ncbi:hypothetical protein V1512DRAFT_263801 [Lipomyces arxii]|uniref:uncharacterized protein n=1 Tax=Lipomyces arxii TaxID=56418 RepID=UPI0034CDD91C
MSRQTSSASAAANVGTDSGGEVVITATPVQVPRPSATTAAFMQHVSLHQDPITKTDQLSIRSDVTSDQQAADELSASMVIAAAAVTDPAFESRTVTELSGTDGILVCTRCKLAKPEESFAKPAGREGAYKFCDTCRETSRQHTSDTRKRKRENGKQTVEDLIDISEVGSRSGVGSIPNIMEITDFTQFYDYFPVAPANLDPALTSTNEDEVPDIPEDQIQVHQKAFLLQGGVSVDGGHTTIAENLRGLNNEPVELFKRIIQAIYDITGFYFARRAKSKSGKSFRTQYVCSQVADTSNNRESLKTPKRARTRRQLFNCHGRLILAASMTDKNVIVKYTHRIVHGPATRRRYLPDAVKEYVLSHRDSSLSEVYNGIKELAARNHEIDSSKITRKQIYIYMKRMEDSARTPDDVKALSEAVLEQEPAHNPV